MKTPGKSARGCLHSLISAGVCLVFLTISLVETAQPVGARVDADPSGVNMPVGDMPGWHQTFKDDFLGTKLDSNWFAYQGQPGDPGGWWDPSHVAEGKGVLALGTFIDPAHCTGACHSYHKYVSGGVGSWFPQTYGLYSLRMRWPDAHGVDASALLWPSTEGHWPPEIDIIEGVGDEHLGIATLHYSVSNHSITHTVVADLTQWHTWTVRWTPAGMDFKLDGVKYASMTKIVPAQPMVLDLQSQTYDCTTSPIWTCPNSTTPAYSEVDVDWVVAYTPAQVFATGGLSTRQPQRPGRR